MARMKEYAMLVDELVEADLDGVDVDTLYEIAYDNVRNNYDQLPMEDVLNIIRDRYPSMLIGTPFQEDNNDA